MQLQPALSLSLEENLAGRPRLAARNSAHVKARIHFPTRRRGHQHHNRDHTRGDRKGSTKSMCRPTRSKGNPPAGAGVLSSAGAGVTSAAGAGVTSAVGAGVTSAAGAGVASVEGRAQEKGASTSQVARGSATDRCHKKMRREWQQHTLQDVAYRGGELSASAACSHR